MEQETENGNQIVQVNEFAIVDTVSGGVRKPGIRIGNEKYGFVKFDQEFKSATLAKSSGGATLCKTAKCIIIGIWEKELKMSNGLNQNIGDATMQVEDIAVYLREKGFWAQHMTDNWETNKTCVLYKK